MRRGHKCTIEKMDLHEEESSLKVESISQEDEVELPSEEYVPEEDIDTEEEEVEEDNILDEDMLATDYAEEEEEEDMLADGNPEIPSESQGDISNSLISSLTGTGVPLPSTAVTLPESEEQREALRKQLREAHLDKPPSTSSKWMYFLSQHRSALSAEHPEWTVAEVTRTAGTMYRNLSPEELEKLGEAVTAAREKYTQDLAAFGLDSTAVSQLFSVPKAGTVSTGNPLEDIAVSQHYLPLARIKKMMKHDPDTRAVSKEALGLITKATELFAASFAMRCASRRVGKTIRVADIVSTIHSTDNLGFLSADFPRGDHVQSKTKSTQVNKGKNRSKDEVYDDSTTSKPSGEKRRRIQSNAPSTTGTKAITSFFTNA